MMWSHIFYRKFICHTFKIRDPLFIHRIRFFPPEMAPNIRRPLKEIKKKTLKNDVIVVFWKYFVKDVFWGHLGVKN